MENMMKEMMKEELFPQLVVTEDCKVVLADGADTEVKMEPLVKAVYLIPARSNCNLLAIRQCDGF